MLLMTLVNTALLRSAVANLVPASVIKTIWLQNKLESFFQISARFRQRFTLRVNAWNFFDPSEVPAAFLFDYGGEFSCHFERF